MNSPLPVRTIRALVLLLPVVSTPAIAGGPAVPGITDEEIVRRAYDPSFPSPPGFYQDPALGGDATLVVVGTPERDAVAGTRSEALRLVRREIASSNVPQLRERPDDEAETEKYFAFRVGTYWWRVHKDSYFEWKESTQWLAPSFTSLAPRTVGALRRRPVGEAEASAFAEYHQVVTGRILGEQDRPDGSHADAGRLGRPVHRGTRELAQPVAPHVRHDRRVGRHVRGRPRDGRRREVPRERRVPAREGSPGARTGHPRSALTGPRR